MNSIFPLIGNKDELFRESAADVLLNILKTSDEYTSFKKQIVEIFLSEVTLLIS